MVKKLFDTPTEIRTLERSYILASKNPMLNGVKLIYISFVYLGDPQSVIKRSKVCLKCWHNSELWRLNVPDNDSVSFYSGDPI